MITKILIWVGLSMTIVCVCAVVVFAALGLIGWAIGSGCAAVLLGFVCRIEADALEAWKNDVEWEDAYRREPRL